MEMNAGEDCVINVQSGQDINIPLDHINNQNGMRENVIVRKLKLLFSAVFSAADGDALYRDSKTMFIVLGAIMAANCSLITSLPSSSEIRDESVRKGALISATFSLLTSLLLMAAHVVMPTFYFRWVKMLITLTIVFTVYSYISFVVMKMGSIGIILAAP